MDLELIMGASKKAIDILEQRGRQLFTSLIHPAIKG